MTGSQRRRRIKTYSISPDETAARYALKKTEGDLVPFSIVPEKKAVVDSRTDTLDIKVPFGEDENGNVRMLKFRVVKALEELQKNPLLKSKALLVSIEDRVSLYSLPEFEEIIKLRKETKRTKRTAARARREAKKMAEMKELNVPLARFKLEDLPPWFPGFDNIKRGLLAIKVEERALLAIDNLLSLPGILFTGFLRVRITVSICNSLLSMLSNEKGVSPDTLIPYGKDENGNVRTLKLKVKEALVKMILNPFLNSRDLLEKVEDRITLYTQPEYGDVIRARKEAKRATSRARLKIKNDAEIKTLFKEKSRLELKIKALPTEEKVPVTPEQVVKADMRQAKSVSYYDAESQALGGNEICICLQQKLSLVKDLIFERQKKAISEVTDLVPVDCCREATDILRKKFGYAPSAKGKVIERPVEVKRYREINIFADDYSQADPDTEALMQSEINSQADAKGWSQLGQAGYINPKNGGLSCSFA